MSTAFQPNAFQSDAFQELGGLTTADVNISVGYTNLPDVASLTIDVRSLTGGSGGKKRRFSLYLNGQRYLGTQEDFAAIVANTFSAVPEAELPSIAVKVEPTKQDRKEADFSKMAERLEQELQATLKQIHKRAYEDREDEEILEFL